MMTSFDLVWLILVSILFGAFLTFAAFCFALHYYCSPKVNKPQPEDALKTPDFEQFQLPQSLLNVINSNGSPKKETCVALNLLFHFLYYELRNSEEVRLWFLKKLTLEFDELLTRSATGKLIDKVSIKEIDLGSKFPIFNSISIQDVVLHPNQKFIETLDLCVDLHYDGGFQLVTSVRLLLGAPAVITVKVCHLSGRARLRFTRQPYSHWSFTFYTEPSLELQVDSQFQGRPVPHITSLIVSQIRKAVKKKHTIPQFKLRYKPFFQAPPQAAPAFDEKHDKSDLIKIPAGVLKVSLIECTRLNSDLVCGDVYCTLAVDEAPWTELVLSDSFAVMTLDLIIFRKPSQSLGATFKFEAPSMVVVDIVERGTPAYFSKIEKGDIFLAVQGAKVTSMSQASKLLKTAGRRFTVRIERKRSLINNPDEIKEGEDVAEKIKLSPQSSPSRVRRRLIVSDQDQPQTLATSETESSGSSTASPSNSPINRPLVKIKAQQPAEENSVASRKMSMATSPTLSGIQIYKTKELPASSELNFNDSVTFHIGDNIKYFNFGMWSTQNGASDEKDVLLGHISIPMHSIVDKCTITGLGHLIKKWQLLEPCVTTKTHQLNGHSGFDPSFCFGDALFCFVLAQDSQSEGNIPSSTRASFSTKGDGESFIETPISLTPVGKESPAHETTTPSIFSVSTEDLTAHDFVRTHFSRTTQCDFCSKKIWLKDAVQCRSCKMTCHKKCVTKCQATAMCVPCEEDPTMLQGMSPAKGPEIVTTEAESESVSTDINLTPTPQSSKRGLGGLLASVAHAAQSRSIKRAGSASNLAPPNGTPSTNSGNTTPSMSLSFSRSLPHSPQVSPSSSRKASIADPSLFDLPGGLAALDDNIDDILVEEGMEQLLQRSFDNEDIMSLAKDTGKQLYSGLPGRKDKINKLISKLKVSMDREMQIQEALHAEAEDEAENASRLSLLKKSEKRVQAITVLMLHCCSGLQHVQDVEEEQLQQLKEKMLKIESDPASTLNGLAN